MLKSCFIMTRKIICNLICFSDKYDRHRSASGLNSASIPQISIHYTNQHPLLKSASTPQIGIHLLHYLKSRSDLRVYSNRCPFQTLR